MLRHADQRQLDDFRTERRELAREFGRLLARPRHDDAATGKRRRWRRHAES